MKFFDFKKNKQVDNQTEPDNVIPINSNQESKPANNIKQRILSFAQQRSALIICALAVLVIFIVVYAMLHRTYRGYKVLVHNDTNYENTAGYTQFGGNLLKYTPDGVSYINANGDTVWTAGVDMKMPMAVSCGDYAVVADMSGNAIFLFNKDGQVSNQTMPYTICDVDVSGQGCIAVVLESDKTNYINCYDKSGDIIYEMQTTIDKSGYPLDIAISNDGQKLVTSYIRVVGNHVENQLATYNFGTVGQNANADRLVGGYTFEDELVSQVEFTDNDTIVAFGTKSITIYSMKEKPSVKKTIKYSGELMSVFSNKKYIGYVQNVTQEGTTEPRYKVTVYNMRGNKEFSGYVEFDYDAIYAADKEIIFSGGSNCKIFRKNGSVKFDGKFAGNIVSVTPTGSHLEYVVVYDTATEIVKLKSGAGKKNKEPKEDETEEEYSTYTDVPQVYIPATVTDPIIPE